MRDIRSRVKRSNHTSSSTRILTYIFKVQRIVIDVSIYTVIPTSLTRIYTLALLVVIPPTLWYDARLNTNGDTRYSRHVVAALTHFEACQFRSLTSIKLLLRDRHRDKLPGNPGHPPIPQQSTHCSAMTLHLQQSHRPSPAPGHPLFCKPRLSLL